MAIRANRTYTVRITGLTAAVSSALDARLLTKRPHYWEVNGHRFAVTDAICDLSRHPGPGTTRTKIWQQIPLQVMFIPALQSSLQRPLFSSQEN